MYLNLETTAKVESFFQGGIRVVERSSRRLRSVVRNVVRRSSFGYYPNSFSLQETGVLTQGDKLEERRGGCQ
jgi:hypothetical protein